MNIDGLRGLLTSMRAADGDWEETAEEHRAEAGLEDGDDLPEALPTHARIRYEEAQEDAGLDIRNSKLPGWIEQLDTELAKLGALIQAIDLYTKVWGGVTLSTLIDEYGFTMTCTEANVFVELLQEFQRPDLADLVAGLHASHDTEEDMHYTGGQE